MHSISHVAGNPAGLQDCEVIGENDIQVNISRAYRSKRGSSIYYRKSCTDSHLQNFAQKCPLKNISFQIKFFYSEIHLNPV